MPRWWVVCRPRERSSNTTGTRKAWPSSSLHSAAGCCSACLLGSCGTCLWSSTRSSAARAQSCGSDSSRREHGTTASRRATMSCFASRLTTAWRPSCSTAGRPWLPRAASCRSTSSHRRRGYSRQHLGRRFNEEFGLSPKLAARIVRFERARRMLQARASTTAVAAVAAACGYFDQSHLHRDFADLAACTPREWLGEDLPDFQDDVTAGDS
jgi:hypothetical protein